MMTKLSIESQNLIVSLENKLEIKKISKLRTNESQKEGAGIVHLPEALRCPIPGTSWGGGWRV